MSEIRGPGNNVEGPAVPGGPGATPSLPPSASVQQLTQGKMQRLSFRVEAARAKRHLEDAEWDAAIRVYSTACTCCMSKIQPSTPRRILRR